ncbi:hypothetical protein SAMN04487897_13433, partial [Paenibacillus sp. yr247]|uniref:hypothetical protein n=1 Tax=Paenibacillus sp. yr247 TaxID=1761880 RepID=UPI00088FEAAB
KARGLIAALLRFFYSNMIEIVNLPSNNGKQKTPSNLGRYAKLMGAISHDKFITNDPDRFNVIGAP